MPPVMTPPPASPTAIPGDRTLIICGILALFAIGVLALFALGVLVRSVYSRWVIEKELDLECTLIDVESAQKMILAHNNLARTPEPVYQNHRTETYREIYRPGPPRKIILDDNQEPVYPKIFSSFPGAVAASALARSDDLAPAVPEADQVMPIENTVLGQETLSAADTPGDVVTPQGKNYVPGSKGTEVKETPLFRLLNPFGLTVLRPVGNIKSHENQGPFHRNLKNNGRDSPSYSGKENRHIPPSGSRRIA